LGQQARKDTRENDDRISHIHRHGLVLCIAYALTANRALLQIQYVVRIGTNLLEEEMTDHNHQGDTSREAANSEKKFIRLTIIAAVVSVAMMALASLLYLYWTGYLSSTFQ
jgi:hypothetical protein